jgi:histidinol-phosphate aminotransferase
LAALGDEEFIERTKALVHEGLKEFYACFERLGLFYVPSQTNFVLVRIGPQAPQVADQLLRRGVIVRAMTSYGLPEFMRVSVGLPPENARFTQQLAAVLGRG